MDWSRWYNPRQPQTLQLSQILLYVNAVSSLLSGLVFGGVGLIGLVLIAGEVFAAHGIANGRRQGWIVGIVVACLALAFSLLVLPLFLRAFSINITYLINLMFEIALVVALIHPQSREYQRIWFS